MKDITFVFKNALALLVIVAIIGYFFFVATHPQLDSNKTVGEIKTAFIGILALILNYYFGSSAGSIEKDKTIKNALENKSDAS